MFFMWNDAYLLSIVDILYPTHPWEMSHFQAMNFIHLIGWLVGHRCSFFHPSPLFSQAFPVVSKTLGIAETSF